MVEILFNNGKTRELQESDISVLIDMCKDEDILKYFFSSGNRNIVLYWNVQLTEQSQWKGRIDISRRRYILPIEHNGIIKGCLTLETKIDTLSKKRQINALTQSWQDSSSSIKSNLCTWEAYKESKKSNFLSRNSRSNQVNKNGPLVEISYFIGKEYRRTGIATEVTRSSLTFAFEKLDSKKVIAKILKSNVASKAVLEKQGFKVEKKSIASEGPLTGERIFIYDLSSTIFDNYLTF